MDTDTDAKKRKITFFLRQYLRPPVFFNYSCVCDCGCECDCDCVVSVKQAQPQTRYYNFNTTWINSAICSKCAPSCVGVVLGLGNFPLSLKLQLLELVPGSVLFCVDGYDVIVLLFIREKTHRNREVHIKTYRQ